MQLLSSSLADWERIVVDGDVLICRKRRGEGDGAGGGLIVVPTLDHPAPATFDRLAHEYELRGELDRGWAALPVELVREHGRIALVLEDPGGLPLERLIDGPMEPGRFLRLAIGLAEALGQVHQRGFIHKDIKPAHALVDETVGKVWLTGFGFASWLPRERPVPEPPEVIAGTLAYMAPEQTGRMNRSVDTRSDLYALGVTLYRMLTGMLPFDATEPMEWVHCHIARRPPPPGERVPAVPVELSAIVMKCLAKTAEERYQTAAGLAADLRRCRRQWEAVRNITPFVPGAHDTPDVLRVPEKLYGREDEVSRLVEAFDRVISRGPTELVLVSGYPGAGKSSVVNELHKVLVPRRGLFAAGKFDQYKRDIPYSTLAQAFQSMIHPLLGKSEVELAHWREAFRAALEPNGALITNLVPDLALIIGDQPPVPDLSPQDEEYRFQLVVRRFIGAFARPDHPLTLFVDDLQWLDAATLKLLEDLATNSELRDLLLVGAYRDNEVDDVHPLRRCLDAIRQAGGIVREIFLAPLGPDDVGLLVADALHCTAEAAGPLAKLVYDKTGGNPFFTIHFLTGLAEERLLTFDSSQVGWVWDLQRIRAKGYTDNVVDLMVGKLVRLPVETQEALKSFACLGNVADILSLALVLGQSPELVHAALREAVRAGLVFRQDDGYAFLHDRVQEAAYSRIPAEARAGVHLRIGRLLASSLTSEEIVERIFEVVNQLNRGSALVDGAEERERIAELNLVASRRAKSSTAHAAALTYLAAGRMLLAKDCWERRHDLAFALEFHRAECEFLIGELPSAEQHVATLSTHATNTAERAMVACLRMDVYSTLDQSGRAIEVCLDYLRQEGIEWSAHPSEEETRHEYERIWFLLGRRTIEDLIDSPLMSDPVSLATVEVVTKVLPAAVLTDANLASLTICRAVNLSIERGNCDASCFAYVMLGRIAGPSFGDYKAGFRFGQVGYDLVERRGMTRFQASTVVCFASFAVRWTKHVRACHDLMRCAFDAANRAGEPMYGAYTCSNMNSNLLFAGDPLSVVQREAEQGLAFAQKARYGIVIDFITTQLALIRMLRGLTPHFGCFDDGQFEEVRFERHLTENPLLAIAECWYRVRKLQARYLAGDYAVAMDAASRAQQLLWTATAFLEEAEYHVYDALCRAACCASASSDQRQQHLEAIGVHLRQLEIWAENCPENFENRRALVAAEIARLEGRDLEAMRSYERAIRSARDGGFTHIEALANELAGRFYFDRGCETTCLAHLRNARAGYVLWGADAKVRQLDQRYPQLVAGDPTLAAASMGSAARHLDVLTMVKASQAVSGEIQLPGLVEALMTITLQNAGADRGLLLLPQGQSFGIEAEARASGSLVEVTLRRSAIGANGPEAVINTVIRTRKSAILDDGAHPDLVWRAVSASYELPRSAVCLPLLRQATLTGVLYLENSLATHAFTQDRVTVLEVLAAQAAISLENARLYGDLQDREAKISRLIEANIIGIVFWALDGRITEANDAFLGLLGYDRHDLLSGRVRWDDMTPPEWRELDRRKLEEIRTTGCCQPFEKEYFHKDGHRVPVLVGVAGFGEVRAEGVALVLDLSERKQAELRQKVMVDELNHRVKNTLATVMAISAQTFRTTTSPEDFRNGLEGRLLALSETHNLLNRTCWTGADLRELVEQALAPHAETGGARLVLIGDEFRLGPVTAVTLGMAFHELATNAIKYGALSVPSGQVQVGWRAKSPGRLRLEWLEMGGPPVRPPQRRGFGSRLLERVLADDLRGTVRLDFGPKGVRCTMDMALDWVSEH